MNLEKYRKIHELNVKSPIIPLLRNHSYLHLLFLSWFFSLCIQLTLDLQSLFCFCSLALSLFSLSIYIERHTKFGFLNFQHIRNASHDIS